MVDFLKDTSQVRLLLVPVPSYTIKFHVALLVQKNEKALSSATPWITWLTF